MRKNFQWPLHLRNCWICLVFLAPVLVSCSDSETVYSPDGGVYNGSLVDGKFHGQGEIVWEYGSRYRGEFEEGYFHGEGELTYSDGTLYKGEFERGMEQGEGEFFLADGDYYRGQVKQGKYQGQGEYKEKNGAIWSGEFADDEPLMGVAINPDGSRYAGGFSDWRFVGDGQLTLANGNSYKGRFESGSLHGRGEYRAIDGEHYQGEFSQGQFHGQGVYRSAEGDVYTGGFEWGLYQGEGKMVLASELDGVREIEGRWHRGDLVDSDNQKWVYQKEEAVESMLYNQSELLEKQLAYLRYQDPDQTELYFLGVGADGSQEVFRREAIYVRDLFAERFNTDRHSLLLINSRQTYEQYPLATRQSLRRALQGIANKMDKENDILFIFLSSHGSASHQVYINQPGLDLPSVTAPELGKMVGELGIRHKVVVVSTCYSGGYIPALDDGSTLIFTAASADKKSFGCADRNEFTYFGRAYFKEGLAAGLGFVEAFTQAEKLVGEWEKEKAVEPSNPQKLVPARAARYLTDWLQSQATVSVKREPIPTGVCNEGQECRADGERF